MNVDLQKYSTMALYIVATLLATLIVDRFIALPFFGLLSVGTLFFGITFTQRDRVHRYGRSQVYGMILVAVALNTLMSALLDVPMRFVIAGFVAMVIAEAADTEVYQRLIKRAWLLRVSGSNAVSIPLDSALFTVIAFAGNPDFPVVVMLAIIYADVLAKTVVGLVAALRLRWLSVPPVT